MNVHDKAQMKRLRGAVVTLVYSGHRNQESRLDDLALWGLMQDLHFDVGENDVLTLLQQLKDFGYLKFEEKKNRRTNRVEISFIELTADGIRLAEGFKADDAVLI
jgi:hypothetical protein